MDPREVSRAARSIRSLGALNAGLAVHNPAMASIARIGSLNANASRLGSRVSSASRACLTSMGTAQSKPSRLLAAGYVSNGVGAASVVGMRTPMPASLLPRLQLTAPQLTPAKPPQLTQTQGGWLAKGIRSWASYVKGVTEPSWAEARPQAPSVYLDLSAFLYGRYQETNRKRAKVGRRGVKSGVVQAWFDFLHQAVLPRLAAGVRPTALSRALLAVLGAPPGWAAAVRFRVVLETLIRRILEQLAEVIAPNAPSRLARRPLTPGGAIALCN
jgi:hypothetical protein